MIVNRNPYLRERGCSNRAFSCFRKLASKTLELVSGDTSKLTPVSSGSIPTKLWLFIRALNVGPFESFLELTL